MPDPINNNSVPPTNYKIIDSFVVGQYPLHKLLLDNTIHYRLAGPPQQMKWTPQSKEWLLRQIQYLKALDSVGIGGSLPNLLALNNMPPNLDIQTRLNILKKEKVASSLFYSLSLGSKTTTHKIRDWRI